MRPSLPYYLVALVCCSALLFVSCVSIDRLRVHRGRERSMVGGVRESSKGGIENSAEIEDLARFAVDEHNKKQNTLLEFAGVVNAKEQVVAGTMYYLTVEAIEGGKKKLYEAKVWVKPWLNFKELQEFTPLADSSSGATAADLGAKQDD